MENSWFYWMSGLYSKTHTLIAQSKISHLATIHQNNLRTVCAKTHSKALSKYLTTSFFFRFGYPKDSSLKIYLLTPLIYISYRSINFLFYICGRFIRLQNSACWDFKNAYAVMNYVGVVVALGLNNVRAETLIPPWTCGPGLPWGLSQVVLGTADKKDNWPVPASRGLFFTD